MSSTDKIAVDESKEELPHEHSSADKLSDAASELAEKNRHQDTSAGPKSGASEKLSSEAPLAKDSGACRLDVLSIADRATEHLKELLRSFKENFGFSSLERGCSYLGEKSDLYGFDRNTGAAVIGRRDSCHESEIRPFEQTAGQLRDSQGRSYEELDLGGLKLYRDGTGEIFVRLQTDGKEVLQELPGLRSMSVEDKRLFVEKSGDGIKGRFGIAGDISSVPDLEAPSAFLERSGENSEKKDLSLPCPKSIAQSNDYATKHELSGKIEDGFRTAGQFREFAADGRFSASDRAATVVDRSRDSKLNEIIEDAKRQFSELPERERAKALADYVNKIMGPKDGDERALDERYRKLMQDNAGREMLLSDFTGSGACTQRAILLKVLADEMGLNCSVIRGNGGSHVWNTFQFDDGKKEIFDTRGQIYGVEKSDMHRPNQPGFESLNGRDYVAGQHVVAEGKNWRVEGYSAKDGNIILSRNEERKVSEAEFRQLNGGAGLSLGENYKLKSAGGSLEEWRLAGRNADGSLNFNRTEEKTMARKELAQSVLELAAPNADVQYLQTNWKTLVGDNAKLSDKQKQDLRASFDLLAGNGNEKIGDFRKLVDEVGRLGTSTAPEAAARINALSKIAGTVANYPEAVHLPVDRLIGATNVDALTQVADSFAQSAPHEVKAPVEVDGTPSRTGDGYEHAASQALQRALLDKGAMEKLIKDGKLPPGDWVFVPASKGSVADDLKIDGMLVDLKTGKAVFIDFAMHQTGRTPYATLAKKLNTGDPKNVYRDGSVKHPWALTLDNDSIGWDPSTGLSTGTVDPAKILERVGSYLKGTQTADLGMPGLRQGPATQYDIARLRADMGGHFPSFGPVKGKLEADLASQDSGQEVKTRQDELADIASRNRASTRPELRILGLAADSAANAASEQVGGSNFFNEGLRAAVEAEKYKARDKVYGPQTKVPDVQLTAGADHDAGLPDKYKGKKYIGVTGDDNVTSTGAPRVATEVRIYENGDVLVRTGGARAFHSIGTIRELGGNMARELQKNGIDPKTFAGQIKELGRVGKNFKQISADIDAVGNGTMTAEKFWNDHGELRLLADGVQHKQASQRAAQEARPVYEARLRIDSNPALSKLPDSQKDALAQKSVDLEAAGHKKLSFEQVASIMQLEKLGLKTAEAVDAARFQRGLGKEAESWTPFDVKRNFESARAAQAKDFSSVKDLPDVYRMQRLQADLSLDAPTAQALFRLKKNLPDASNADLLAVKGMYDALKAAGLRSLNLEGAANIYARHGSLSQAEIAEAGRLGTTLKSLKPEELAGVAVRNVQVESLYGVPVNKADEIRGKVAELVKAAAPLEQVHDAAALMVLKNMPQAEALEMAKTLAELRQRSHFTSFSELADTASLLQGTRNLGADSIRAELAKLLADGIDKHGSDLGKLKEFLHNELYTRGTDSGAHQKDWEKVYDAVDRCRNTAELARLLGLPSDAAAQRAALEGYLKLFKAAVSTELTAAPVVPMKLSDIDKKGLDLAREMKKQLAGLELKTHPQVLQFLRGCLDEIDNLPQAKKWKDADRDAFAKLVDSYAKGEGASVAAVNAYLDVKVPATAGPSTAGRPQESTGGQAGQAGESVSLADLERKLKDPIERATVMKKIEDEGPIRNTLTKAGMTEERARKLEKDLLSEKDEVRENAKREIAKYYESRGRGGFRGFAREATGRMGALVMVAAVVLPWLLSGSASGSEPDSQATWSGGGNR